MRAPTIIVLVGAMFFGLPATALADALQDALFAACVSSGTYRNLPIAESETCQCLARVVPQHLTPAAVRKIIDGEAFVMDAASYIGGNGPVSTDLLQSCPGVKVEWD